jgi:hypothetical protein
MLKGSEALLAGGAAVGAAGAYAADVTPTSE